jgi:hypothetical protein
MEIEAQLGEGEFNMISILEVKSKRVIVVAAWAVPNGSSISSRAAQRDTLS